MDICTEYLHGYVDLMSKAKPDYDKEKMAIVENRQAAYDQYSALKDPAVGLFDAYFGNEKNHMMKLDIEYDII